MKYALFLILAFSFVLVGQENTGRVSLGAPPEALSLNECLQRAISGNHRHKISQFAVALAEAQHRQALSGYWPQLNLRAGIQRSDQPIDLLLPAQTLGIPAQQIPVAGGAALVTIPANAFGPGFPPGNVQLPANSPGQTIRTPAQAFTVAQQDFKLADRDLGSGNLTATWLLFDGGLRTGLREQARAGVNAMLAEAKRTDLEVADSVSRLYWAAVLAHQLRKVGNDTVSQLEVTLQMTDAHTRSGSGKTNKTDYLYNKVVLESTRSVVAELEKNETLSQAALANTMGMPWNTSVSPLDQTLPAIGPPDELNKLVSDSYEFNPDWEELEAGLQAAAGALKNRRSDYFPKLAIKGDLHSFWNGGYNGGLSTPQNRFGWTLGAGVEVPIFNGLLTQNQVSEALLKIRQLKETQLLLKDGLGLQVKSMVVEMETAAKIGLASAAAMKAAEENRELNMSAYENDMAEPDKVIQSQIMEALATAQYHKSQYDQVSLLSRLSTIVGRQVGGLITGTPATGAPVSKP